MTKTIGATANGDLASELLRELRIASSVLCRSVMAAPWGFAVAGREVGSFHMVLEGGGWLEAEGVPDPIRLGRGDLVVLPLGGAHRVLDSLSSTAPMLESILAEREVVDGELRFGGGTGPSSEIVCGIFTSEGPWPPPWVRRLPAVVRSTDGEGRDEWRRAAAVALRDEARSPTEGGSAMVNRLLESLIVDALRPEVVRSASEVGAPIEALADDRIGRVLALIRERPEAAWNLELLAGAAAMSRSTFATRFRSLVGDPPMRYVADVRLSRAARFLRSTDKTVADVARRVGYTSESALSRAFKARFGQAPSAFRRLASAGPAASHASN